MNYSVRRVLGALNVNGVSVGVGRRCYYSSGSGRRSKSSSPSTVAASPKLKLKTLPKPTEIPFQAKLANSVNLIGQIHEPLQFQTSPDGNTWAATVITRQHSPSSPSLWIPVIFEGDLAHTAVCHLKQNDYIHIAGQLTTDQNPAAQTNNFQVMVQSLNFVQDYPQVKREFLASKQKVFSSSESEEDNINPSRKDVLSKGTEENDIDKSWKDLLHNTADWWDVRSAKDNPKGAAFERKTNGELLFINGLTPKWLQDKLESMTIDLKPEPKQSTTVAKKDPDSLLSSWKELLHVPKQWCDFRDRKLNGLVNPRYPDFKRKDGSVALWLNKAPKWILSELNGLEFDTSVVKSNQAKDGKGDQSWNDLVQNPAKWWDNRLNKRNKRAPDFKHKETGEGLWLGDSPSWVLPKLPPLKPEQSVVTNRKQALVS